MQWPSILETGGECRALFSPKDRHNFLLLTSLLLLPISKTQEDHASGISQSYSRTTISPESDREESFIALVREFLKENKNCLEDVVHNHVKFQAGIDVNLTWRRRMTELLWDLQPAVDHPMKTVFHLHINFTIRCFQSC